MNPFRLVISAATLTLGLSANTFAADAPTQQNKMTMCNQQAGSMMGDERKKFMSSCLKKSSSADTQQDKMKHCNAAAAGKTGDERKTFMSQCLKKIDA